MKLSLSVRIAETASKDRLTIEFDELARLAVRHGYHAMCLRPSVVGVTTPQTERATLRRILDDLRLAVIKRVGRANFGLIYEPANLMLCGDEYGPKALKQLAPHIMNVYVQNHRMNSTGNTGLPTRVRGEVRYDMINHAR